MFPFITLSLFFLLLFAATTFQVSFKIKSEDGKISKRAVHKVTEFLNTNTRLIVRDRESFRSQSALIHFGNF